MRAMTFLLLALGLGGCGQTSDDFKALPITLQNALGRAQQEGKALLVHLGGSG
jgi:hypothetical protein